MMNRFKEWLYSRSTVILIFLLLGISVALLVDNLRENVIIQTLTQKEIKCRITEYLIKTDAGVRIKLDCSGKEYNGLLRIKEDMAYVDIDELNITIKRKVK